MTQHNNANIAGFAVAGSGIAALVSDILRGRDDRSQAMRVALFAFLVRVASAGLAYLSQVFMARWIGSSEYGVFVTVWVMILLVGGLAPVGLSTAAQRFPPEYAERGEHDLLRGYIAGSRGLAFALASLIGGLGAAGVYLLEPWIDGAYVMPIYLACICLPMAALMEVQDGIARSYNWPDLAHALPYIVRPAAILLLMGLFLEYGAPRSAETAMLALIAAIWLTGLVQFLALGRRLGRVIEKGERRYLWKRWLTASLPIFLIDGFYVLLTSTDVLVLSFYRDPTEVGVYFATARTLALVSFVYFAVTAACAHRFSAYHARGETERLHAFVRDAVRWTFWPSLAACVGMLLVGRLLLSAFGHEYIAGYPLMFILAFGLLARAAVGPVERLLNMLDQQIPCAIAIGTAFAANLALNLALIPFWGLYGAAVATAVAYVVESVLLFRAARKQLGIDVVIWSRS